MSLSPPIRRLSTSSKREEDLINAYEAEEERIINILSRKLEKLREEKIDLENALEAESESHVNRLSRELSALRLAQQVAANGTGSNGSVSTSPDTRQPSIIGNGAVPSPEIMLDAMRRENEQLRSRLVATERDYIRITRTNDIYREELIDLRQRLGLSVDHLIGLPAQDPLSQPLRRRSSSGKSVSVPRAIPIGNGASSSRQSSTSTIPTGAPVPMPIPRPSSRIHRPSNPISELNTPASHSPPTPGSGDSSYPISPVVSPLWSTIGTHHQPSASVASNGTVITTPASSASLHGTPPAPYHLQDLAGPSMSTAPIRILSYPSNPPPSLSSSFGSPQTPYHFPSRDPSQSPVDNRFSRRGSADRRVAESGTLRSVGGSPSRRQSVERGARVAETGSLVRQPSRGAGIASQAAEVPVLFEDKDLESQEDGDPLDSADKTF